MSTFPLASAGVIGKAESPFNSTGKTSLVAFISAAAQLRESALAHRSGGRALCQREAEAQLITASICSCGVARARKASFEGL